MASIDLDQGGRVMNTVGERRNHPRTDQEGPLLCILQAKGVACDIDAKGSDVLYHFVDMKDCSDGGPLLHVPFQLAAGTVCNISQPDRITGAWSARPARIVWTEMLSPGHYCSRIEYLETGPGACEAMPWETDPLKPLPADLSFLINASFFQAISEVGLCVLLNALRKNQVRAGERIIAQGEPGECLFLIQRGACVVFVEMDGDMHRIARLKPGDVVGEMAVLTGEPRTANVDAETDMILWKLDREQFDALTRNHPDLRLFLTEIMSNRFDNSLFVGDRTIGKYVLNRKIGAGGWGIVYRGTHKLLKMPVAIKMMKHDMAMDPEFLANFRREAEIIAKMRHPNIVSVYDIEEIYKTIFIVMEYLEGIALEDHLEKIGALPVDRCVHVLQQICNGLACAHSYDIVHRDIKPANIFLMDNDLVKLLDFGLACASGTEELDIAGTAYYAPPEQIQGRPVDFRSDLYSLGIMAYEMVVGQRPFPEDNLAGLLDLHCNEDIPDPALRVPDIPRELRKFILTCCRRDPEQRYHGARQASEELQPLCSSQSRPQVMTQKYERGVTSLVLIHSPEQQQALKGLLEEFGAKAAKLGVNLLMSEFKNV